VFLSSLRLFFCHSLSFRFLLRVVSTAGDAAAEADVVAAGTGALSSQTSELGVESTELGLSGHTVDSDSVEAAIYQTEGRERNPRNRHARGFTRDKHHVRIP
jgi:hypothetical protein